MDVLFWSFGLLVAMFFLFLALKTGEVDQGFFKVNKEDNPSFFWLYICAGALACLFLLTMLIQSIFSMDSPNSNSTNSTSSSSAVGRAV